MSNAKTNEVVTENKLAFDPSMYNETEVPQIEGEILKPSEMEEGDVFYCELIEIRENETKKNGKKEIFDSVVFKDLQDDKKIKSVSASALVNQVKRLDTDIFTFAYQGMPRSNKGEKRRYHAFEVKGLELKD